MSQHKETLDPQTDPAPIAINGFGQVLELLKVADPAFRESLLRRLAHKDPKLANSLRRDLRELEY
jgi:hypothetical protein